ncbi:hypothetical protein H0H87_001339 [Tephrocybe sp. NHM501043]|nr:hypothetical protein H0H87_001339 [Tephrocybe sp. NHM501043]
MPMKPPPSKVPRIDDHVPPRAVAPLPRPPCQIHKLSDELLLIIFGLYLNDEEDRIITGHPRQKPAITSTLSSSARPSTLLAVCRRWMSMRIKAPLWSSLAVYEPRMEQIPMITAWLERSLDAPLSLYLDSPTTDENSYPALQNILGLFLSEQILKRLQHITIRIVGYYFPFEIKSPLYLYAPLLRSVELDLEAMRRRYDPIWMLFCGPRTVKKVSWCPSNIQGAFSSIDWALLTHLKLSIVHEEPNGVGLDQLMKAFRHCTRLVDMQIAMNMPQSDIFPPPHSPYTPDQCADALRHIRQTRTPSHALPPDVRDAAVSAPIDLPCLRHLKVEAHLRDSEPLLARICVPNLETLQIVHFSSTQRSGMLGITSLLERSHAEPIFLSLFDPNMRRSETIKLVNCPQLRKLVRLELLVGPIGDSVMRAITDAQLMPQLRRLVLPNCCTSIGVLPEMVKSRVPMLQELRLSMGSTAKSARRMSSDQYLDLKSLKGISEEEKGHFLVIVD